MTRSTTPSTVAVVGHTGLIGSHVASLLEQRGYDVRGVTHQTSPALDLTDPASIEGFFAEVAVDHVIVAAGDARFGGFEELDAAAFERGLRHKLMGQVAVAMAALRHLPRGGSVTLTSGALAHTPIPGSAGVALVNGALDSFVRAIALDAPAGRRINAVSPGWIRETRIRMGLDPAGATSAADVARLYLRSIEHGAHGEIISASLTPSVDAALPFHRLAHVGVRVADFDRSVAFYRQLGFEVTRQDLDERVVAMRHESGLELNLLDTAEPAGPPRNALMDEDPRRPGYTHLALHVADVHQAARQLAELGLRVTEGPVTFGDGSTSVFLRDPDLNVIELAQPAAV